MLPIVLVAGEEPLDVRGNERTDLRAECLRQLLNKLEAISAASLDIGLLKVIPDIRMRVILIFILIITSDSNVREDEHIKYLLTIAFHKFDLARIVDHIAKILHRGLNEILALL